MTLFSRMHDADREARAAAVGYQPLPFLLMQIGTFSFDLFRDSGTAMRSLARRTERRLAHGDRVRAHTARAAIRVAEQSLKRTNIMLAGSVVLAVVIVVCAVVK